jgi:hypothetical protein
VGRILAGIRLNTSIDEDGGGELFPGLVYMLILEDSLSSAYCIGASFSCYCWGGNFHSYIDLE